MRGVVIVVVAARRRGSDRRRGGSDRRRGGSDRRRGGSDRRRGGSDRRRGGSDRLVGRLRDMGRAGVTDLAGVTGLADARVVDVDVGRVDVGVGPPLAQVGVVGAGGEVPADERSVWAAHQAAGISIPVDHRVVRLAQQGAVIGGGGSTVGPVDQVVRIAPLRRSGAVREGAAVVTQPQVTDLRAVEEPFGATLVEHLSMASQDGGDDLGVTGHSADGVDGEQVVAQAKSGSAAALLQLIEPDGHDEGRLGVPPDAVGRGDRPGHQLQQRIGAPRCWSTRVALTGLGVRQRNGQGVDGGVEDRGSLVVEDHRVAPHAHRPGAFGQRAVCAVDIGIVLDQAVRAQHRRGALDRDGQLLGAQPVQATRRVREQPGEVSQLVGFRHPAGSVVKAHQGRGAAQRQCLGGARVGSLCDGRDDLAQPWFGGGSGDGVQVVHRAGVQPRSLHREPVARPPPICRTETARLRLSEHANHQGLRGSVDLRQGRQRRLDLGVGERPHPLGCRHGQAGRGGDCSRQHRPAAARVGG